jgi:hypothetical protein
MISAMTSGTTTSMIDLLGTIAMLGGLLVGLVIVLVQIERNHRRASQLPQVPWGADPQCDRDLARIVGDLAVTQDPAPRQSDTLEDRSAPRIPHHRGRTRLA